MIQIQTLQPKAVALLAADDDAAADAAAAAYEQLLLLSPCLVFCRRSQLTW